jgi:hypothetical protein
MSVPEAGTPFSRNTRTILLDRSAEQEAMAQRMPIRTASNARSGFVGEARSVGSRFYSRFPCSCLDTLSPPAGESSFAKKSGSGLAPDQLIFLITGS